MFSCSNVPGESTIHNFVDKIQPSITQEQNLTLTCEVTNEEIWNAVNSIGALKALDLMGYMLHFIKDMLGYCQGHGL